MNGIKEENMRRATLSALLVCLLIVPAVSATGYDVQKSGTITAKTENSIVVQGVTFLLDEETKYKEGDREDLAVGVEVKVAGEYVGEELRAREIWFKTECEEEVVAYGPVTGLTSDTLTVQGKTFVMTEETEFEHGTKADLAVGFLVKVKGSYVGEQLQARVVDIKGDASHDDIKVQGAITAMGDDSITVSGKTFLITDETKFEHGSRADLAIGVTVKVEGEQDGSRLLAEKIEFKDDGDSDGKPDTVEVEGLITVLGDNSLTVANKTFALTGKTRYIKTAFDKLTVGMMVKVKGEIVGGKLTALYVKPLDNEDGDHGMVSGVLSAIAAGDGTTRLILTLEDGSSFQTDAALRVDGRHGLKSTAADLITGLTLRIQFRTGEVAGATVNEVKNIWIVGYDKIRGRIDAAGAAAATGYFTVEGTTVLYDSVTIVIGSKQGITNPADLPAGTRVEVLGNAVDDGSILANKIVVTAGGNDDEPGKCKDSGIVESVSGSEGAVTGFVLNNKSWIVTEGTVFKVKGCSTPFDPADFAAGLPVKVVGTTDGTTCTATLVQISLPSLRFSAAIEAVGEESVTILGHDLIVTPYTRLKEFPEGTTLADLASGDLVEIKVFLWPDGTYIVEEIKPADDNGKLELKGLITAKSTSGSVLILEVSGLPVMVTAETVVIGDIEDFIVGVRVEIEGSVGEDGTIVALKIELD